jgi:hypothetical protein
MRSVSVTQSASLRDAFRQDGVKWKDGRTEGQNSKISKTVSEQKAARARSITPCNAGG